MKKNSTLKGIFKLIGTTLLMCCIGLFLCGIDVFAYDVVDEYKEDSEGNVTYTGFHIEAEDEDAVNGIEIYIDGNAGLNAISKINVPANGKSASVAYTTILTYIKINHIELNSGDPIKFVFYNGSSVWDGVSSYESPVSVYKFSDCVEIDPESTTAISKLGYDISFAESTYVLEGTKVSNPSVTFNTTSDYTNKVKGKYLVNGVTELDNRDWGDIPANNTISFRGDFIAGEDFGPDNKLPLYFLPKIDFRIATVPDFVDTDNLSAADELSLVAKIFANEDEEDSYEGYEGNIKWTCKTESGVQTVCENDSTGGGKGEVYETDGLTGNDFTLSVDKGQTGSATWKYSLDISGGYPSTIKYTKDVEKTFVYTTPGLYLQYGSKIGTKATPLQITVTEGTTFTGSIMLCTTGGTLDDYSDISVVSPSGAAKAYWDDTGKITLGTITGEGTMKYIVSAHNDITNETETLEFYTIVMGQPEYMQLGDGCDEITSGLTMRLTPGSTLRFFDSSMNEITGVVIKSVTKVKEDDNDYVLEVKKDNSGYYVIAGDPGTMKLRVTLEDGSFFVTPEITVYPMPTVSYESNRSLKVTMPFKVGIPGSKDSLRQVTGFKLYVYHEGDKLGEFDMSDLSLSSFSSSSSKPDATKQMTVPASAIEKVVTNLANNGRFSGDSMGITFKAVPVGKRRTGGSSTYETNKDKVYGEDSTTVYRVGVSVTGCTVTQSSRYGLNGQEISFTSDQSNTTWTGVGTGTGSQSGTTAKYTVGTNTSANLGIKATANGSSTGTNTPGGINDGTNSANANGTGAGAGGGDGLDDVPKTSESNAPMWLIVIVVLAAIGGAYALYLQLRPVTEIGYYEEDEEDRPNF